VGSDRLAEIGAAGSDLAALDGRVQAGTAKAGLAARARCGTAAAAVAVSDLLGSGEPLVLLDVPSAVRSRPMSSRAARSGGGSLVTLPAEDYERRALVALGLAIEPVADDRPAAAADAARTVAVLFRHAAAGGA
jgi:hypothetical protein